MNHSEPVSWLAAACVAAALTLSVAVPSGKAVPPPAPAAAHASTPEPHPEIREAIAALRRAKAHLQHAAHDFGGHRADPIRAVDQAIEQLQTCLRYDKD